MNDSILSEDRISLGDLARLEGVNISTVWRWALRGIKGCRLEAFNIGGRKFTTRAAYERWLVQLNGNDLAASVTARRRLREIQLAEQGLDAMGA